MLLVDKICIERERERMENSICSHFIVFKKSNETTHTNTCLLAFCTYTHTHTDNKGLVGGEFLALERFYRISLL